MFESALVYISSAVTFDSKQNFKGSKSKQMFARLPGLLKSFQNVYSCNNERVFHSQWDVEGAHWQQRNSKDNVTIKQAIYFSRAQLNLLIDPLTEVHQQIKTLMDFSLQISHKTFYIHSRSVETWRINFSFHKRPSELSAGSERTFVIICSFTILRKNGKVYVGRWGEENFN